MKIEKVEKLVTNLYDKNGYVINIKYLKQPLNHRLTLRKSHRVITFNQKTWQKLYTDLNTDLRRKAKNHFEKDLFMLINNAVFEKKKGKC